MKIDWIEIKDLGGIHNLYLEFNDGLNLICGMNGVGKTTILESIVHSFTPYHSGKLKRNAKVLEGSWSISIDGEILHNTVKDYRPLDNSFRESYFTHLSKNVLYIKENRSIEYTPVDIKRDEIRDDYAYSTYLVNGMTSNSIKTWFINREAFIHQGKFTESEIANNKIAKDVFSRLDPQVKYSHIAHDTLDIMLETTRGEVYFEYLSSGFKSALFIVLGIIREIEYNITPKIKASDFDGLILVDELDAHLHPNWQGVLVKTLKEVFQSAQIIATTHSPHMVQEAEADEIIALGLSENSETIKLDIERSEYGFQGWTVEEILEDVMGMKETRSNQYIEVKSKFEVALTNGDYPEAKANYDTLMRMLHPRSPMKKIYELQLGTLGE